VFLSSFSLAIFEIRLEDLVLLEIRAGELLTRGTMENITISTTIKFNPISPFYWHSCRSTGLPVLPLFFVEFWIIKRTGFLETEHYLTKNNRLNANRAVINPKICILYCTTVA
jgi:hypothetical protein